MITSLCHYSYYRPYVQWMQAPTRESSGRKTDYFRIATIVSLIAVEALLILACAWSFSLISTMDIMLSGAMLTLLEWKTLTYNRLIKRCVVWQRNVIQCEQYHRIPNHVTKPIALLLNSKELPPPALYTSQLHQLEIQHTVIWQCVQTENEAEQAIKEVAKIGPISHLIWNAHGSNRGMRLSRTNEGEEHLVSANSISLIETIKRSLQRDATIVLWSCQTAKEIKNHSHQMQYSPSPHNTQEAHFARTLAQATARRVIGARTKMNPLGVSVKQGSKLKFKIYYLSKLPVKSRFLKREWDYWWRMELPKCLRKRLSRDVTYDSHHDPLVN